MRFTDYLLILFLFSIIGGVGYTLLSMAYHFGEAAAWELCK